MPRQSTVCTFLFLLVGLAPLAADSSSFDQFSRGWGVAAGAGSGVGLSYRQMDSVWGYQVTGVAFLTPNSRTSDPVYYSLGGGLLRPLGNFTITDSIASLIYLQASVATMGSVRRDGAESFYSMGGGLGFGVEWLFFRHFSLNLELTETFLAADGASAWSRGNARSDSAVVPQAAFYFRY